MSMYSMDAVFVYIFFHQGHIVMRKVVSKKNE